MGFYSRVDDLLWAWASQTPPIHNFTVNNVMAATGIDLKYYERVLRYLLSKEGLWLNAGQMLLCPENHPGDVLPLGMQIDEDDVFDCWCGEEYHYSPDHAVLVFNFTEDFREEADVKKNCTCRSA